MKNAARPTLAFLCALAALAALAALPSCRRKEPEDERSPIPPSALPPLAAPASAYALPVAGFADAVVAVPAGVTRAAPVLVAVLGIGDTPESQCAIWRELVGARAFVLCPRGLPHFVREAAPAAAGREASEETDPAFATAIEETTEASPDSGRVTQVGFHHPDLATLEREVDAGLASLRARVGAYVAAGPVLYTGFSRGAFLGASLVGKAPERYSRAVFIEGGQSAWNDETAAAFAKHGGKRLLFACGRPSCVSESEAAAVILGKHHVETRVVYGEGEGHDYKGEVKNQLRASFDWVTDGDPLWRRQLVAGGRMDHR